VTLDLLIPFAILLILVIYLIYTRTKFEKDMLKLYEEKFEEWKKHTSLQSEDKSKKELVALVFEENYKLKVEMFKDIEDRLKRAKFDTKLINNENIGKNNE
jgi:hypothetical protein